MNQPPKLSVCCITYNQIDYIESCIQSLLNQNTSFDYEIIIGDDCSTDGTSEVVRQYAELYPKKIKAILRQKNIGARDNFIGVNSAATGKYIAHIDCDDYALPNKLQKQVDLMEDEPDCNIVFHRMRIDDEHSDSLQYDRSTSSVIWNSKFSRGDIISLGCIGLHSSKMYRAENRDFGSLPDPTIDFTLHVLDVGEGYARVMSNELGVYRKRSGTERSTPNQTKKMLDQLVFIKTKFFPS